MAVVSKNMTYEHTPVKVQRSYSGIEGKPEAGTVSGSIITTAATNTSAVSFNNRWEVMEFSNATDDMAVWNHIVPYSYLPEFGIELEIEYTGTGGGGNFAVLIGIAGMVSDGTYALDSETRYQRFTIPAPTTSGDISTLTAFESASIGVSASIFLPNRNISLLMVREGASGGDTATSTFDVSSVRFNWYENKEGTLTI